MNSANFVLTEFSEVRIKPSQHSATYGCSRAWQKCAAEDEQAPLLAEDVERHADGTP